ncbi:4-diphosphocytidyl-2-C-methyl-D-erythritol kinase [Thiogranum longum]|uniref:4-diphosphocytidyl-2-C-methyl-D-erythritol kinase n=1 Tax=Thiogranum longum TaxID=1537524 RepID=A0A4V2PH39_9GAMM|nr:4-diphosphocytidyl-2-C-methyl-D-erythritol kinase [Thiogranum longum]
MRFAREGEGWPAPAKINRFLHVTGQRADGYHELQTVFQFLDYGDRLWFERLPGGLLELTGGLPGVATEDDLVFRAARALQRLSGYPGGVRITLDKRLPVGGGLGGGSSDAATTLVALNHLWQLGLDVHDLADLGLQLGADVPVFVHGQAAWAEGVGERLTPLDQLDSPWFLVLDPALSISTAEIFSDPQLTRNTRPLKIPAFLSGAGANDLQAVVVRHYPEVANALNWLSKYQPARMTGSGACVFAAFPEEAEARAVLEQLPAPWTGFVARGCNRSPLMERLARAG